VIDREQTLAAYTRAWERADEPEIRAELERCLTSDSTHVSPLSGVLTGIEGVANLILDFPIMFPDARLRVTGRADIHHDKTFYTWRLTSTTRIRMMGHDYGMSLDGVDFVEFAPEGVIRRVTSFFGAQPPAGQHPTGQHPTGATRHNGHANGTRRNGYSQPERRTPPLGVGVPDVLHLEETAGQPQPR
jgi:hypothetical protein